MEGVMSMDALASKPATQPKPLGQQMPLTFLHANESAHVLKVRGTDEMHHHLENLGFVPGALLRVVSEQAGNVIIEIKGAQIALDRTAASKVITN